MTYTLWDTATSNRFGQFEDERDALALVRTLTNHYGARYADDLGLGRVTPEGAILEPLSGAALIARVHEFLSDSGSVGMNVEALIASGRRHRGAA